MITYRGVVYPWHCDHMGHMNVMWYMSKFDEAAWSYFASIGITSTYIREKKCGMAAVEQHIQYKKEVLAGDVLIVKTQLIEIHEKVINFRHELINVYKEETAATTDLTGVHLDLTTRKACPFPKEVVALAKEQSNLKSC